MNLPDDTRDTRRASGVTPVLPFETARDAFSSLETDVLRARSRNETLALLLVSADQLDEIEASQGAWMREAAVAAVSFRVRQVTRSCERVFRLPGGCVGIALRACPAVHLAGVARRVLTAILSAPLVGPDGAIPLSASAGVAVLGPGDDRAPQLLERGLKTLFEAQESGACQLRMPPEAVAALPS
jgi:GGDEF domain-containing protein